MKPQLRLADNKARTRQQSALDAIELSHEKDGGVQIGWETFGGPILSETRTHAAYDEMLHSRVGRYAVVDNPIPLYRRVLQFIEKWRTR